MKLLFSVISLIFSATSANAAPASLTMVYSENAAPVSWQENNTAKGIFVDVVEEIVKNQLGIPVKHLVLPWARAQQMISNNQADGLVTVATPIRQSMMNISRIAIQTHQNRLMASASHPKLAELKKIDGLEDLQPYRIGIHRGNSWAEENLKSYSIFKVSKIEQLLKMVAAQRIDFLLQGDAVTLYYRKQLGLTDELVLLPHVFSSLDFKFMVHKNSSFAELPVKFDQALEGMINDGRLEAIFVKYR